MFSSLSRLFRPSPLAESVRRLYAAIVGQSRMPAFYTCLGVPDTPTGRFEMMALHGFLVLHRLKGESEAIELGQALSEAIVSDIDRNVRELGTGDLRVGTEVRHLTQVLYGRFAKYDEGLESGDADLGEVLAGNLYAKAAPTPEQNSAMVAYIRREVASLAAQPLTELSRGEVSFGPALLETA